MHSECGRRSGITLIELVTALVIIAVFAAAAIPSYRSHLDHAWWSEATAARLQLRAEPGEVLSCSTSIHTANPVAPPSDGLGLIGLSQE